MIWYVVLFFVGLFLSAFFSGSETGFYRVTRLRLLLDAGEGSRVARGLLNLSNHPALFVATTLVGNNVANYLTSLAIVLCAREAATDSAQWAELLAPLAMTPVVFVYGELLPKHLYFHAPNVLLRRGGPLLLLFTLLFAPISAVLWLLGWLVELLVGQKPLKLQSQLARQELRGVWEDGVAAGILRPAQQQISRRLFDIAALPASRRAVPIASAPSVSEDTLVRNAIKTAQQLETPTLLVREKSELKGYVRLVDLRLGDPDAEVKLHLRPMLALPSGCTHLAAVMKLHAEDHDVAKLVDAERNLGVVFNRDLVAELLEV
ncbi:MAG: DUF21 domain-containing protein [Planctomycetales bacterium]|nr:DUF21 domain-containing protein [Planctomycetales bacterium]